MELDVSGSTKVLRIVSVYEHKEYFKKIDADLVPSLKYIEEKKSFNLSIHFPNITLNLADIQQEEVAVAKIKGLKINHFNSDDENIFDLKFRHLGIENTLDNEGVMSLNTFGEGTDNGLHIRFEKSNVQKNLNYYRQVIFDTRGAELNLENYFIKSFIGYFSSLFQSKKKLAEYLTFVQCVILIIAKIHFGLNRQVQKVIKMYL